MSILSKISKRFSIVLNESVEFDKFDTFELDEIKKWINAKQSTNMNTFLVDVPKGEYYILVAASQDETKENILTKMADSGIKTDGLYLDPLDYDHEIFTECVNEAFEIAGKNVENNLAFYKTHKDFIDSVVRSGKVGTYQAYAIRPKDREVDIIGTKGIATYDFDLKFVKFWDNTTEDFDERNAFESEGSDSAYSDEGRYGVSKQRR
jgi:hypothetical protein